MFLWLALAGCGLAAEVKPIRIGVEFNSPPLSFVNAEQQPQGFTAELLREVGRAGNIEFVVVPSSWSAILAEFQTGKLDALANVTITDERLGYMDFSITHASLHAVTYNRPGAPPFRHTSEFRDRTMATLAGTVVHLNAVKHGGWGARIVLFPSWHDMLLAVKNGDCDFALLMRPLKFEQPDEMGLKREFVDDIVYNFHIAVHRGDSGTLARVNEALATVRHDGSFDQVYRKWIGPIEPRPIQISDLRPYFWPAGILLGAVVLFLGWRQHVYRRLAAQARALQLSEARLRQAQSLAQIGHWSWEIGSDKTIWSDEMLRIYGITREEFTGRGEDYIAMTHPEDRAQQVENIRRDVEQAEGGGSRPPFESGTGASPKEFRIVRRNGEIRWVRGSAVVDVNAEGVPVRMLGILQDITERKQAADALADSVEQFRLFMDNSPLIAWIKDEQGRHVFVNKGAVDHHGDRLKDWRDKSDAELWPPEDAARARRDDLAMLASGRNNVVTTEEKHGNGTASHWLTSRFCFSNASGARFVAGVSLDITARKLAEEALRESEQHFRLLFEYSPFCIHQIDREGRITLMNRAGLRMMGVQNESAVCGQPYLSAVAAEDRGRVGRLLQLALQGQASEFEFAASNGLLFASAFVPLTDAHGAVNRLMGLTQDITERKRAEAALVRSESEQRKLAESLATAQAVGQIGSWETDFATSEVRWSEQTHRIFETPPEMFKPTHPVFLAFVHPDDRVAVDTAFLASADVRTPCSIEHRIVMGDGRIKHVEEQWQTFADKEGRPARAVGTCRDVTARKQAAADAQRLERKLLEAQKLESLGVLAGGIAHDFNNILTGIIISVDLASRGLPADSREQGLLTTIRQNSLRAAELCNQMLAYSGRGRFVVQHCSLNPIVEETLSLLEHSISKKATLRLNLAPNLLAVEADAAQLRQVIMNLVINASEALGDRTGVITLTTGETRIDPTQDSVLAVGTYACLEVTDTGSGMSPETQAKIFDPFFTTKFTGRGLGLAAVLGIVRGHKGSIGIESTVGEGTTFRVLLPAVAGAAVAPAAANRAPEPPWHAQGCVLIVDDDEPVRSSVALLLEILGFEVATAADGREAVAAFQAQPHRFFLVLLDLTMPHMDGVQTFTALRQIREGVRVVMMSGYDDQEVSARFKEAKPAGFLQKPFTTEKLKRFCRT